MQVTNNKGFTLIELSIVIVIISLITAAVLGGQTLILNARVKSVMGEANAVRSAISAFRLDYNASPGDITKASTFWLKGCRKDGDLTANSVAAECNGNGDKNIKIAAGDTGEMYMVWLHLQLSKLYPGSFAPGDVLTGDIGVNIPSSSYTNAGITVGYDETDSGNDDLLSGRSLLTNIMVFGGESANAVAKTTLFAPKHVQMIDEKIDDGHPLNGMVVGSGIAGGGGGDCISNTTPAEYNLDSFSPTACSVGFIVK